MPDGNHQWLYFIIAALATWRLTHLLAFEDGPWDCLARLRARLGAGFWGRLTDCFYCLSLWIALPITFAMQPGWGHGLLVWLGLSGAACLLDRLGQKEISMQRVD
jgi:hypothetical protein